MWSIRPESSTADIRSDLADKSKDLEEKSGIQLVVATVTSLQGSDIETYANELFRTWKLGQAQKNNGVLLLVAPNERKVRIEVGYGLEGTLTDAVASVIISSAIVPRFKNGDFPGGIERGVGGILDVLGGDTTDWQPQAGVREDNQSFLWALFPLFGSIGLLIVVQLFASVSGGSISACATATGIRRRWATMSSAASIWSLFPTAVGALRAQAVRGAAAIRRAVALGFFRRRRVVGRRRCIR